MSLDALRSTDIQAVETERYFEITLLRSLNPASSDYLEDRTKHERNIQALDNRIEELETMSYESPRAAMRSRHDAIYFAEIMDIGLFDKARKSLSQSRPLFDETDEFRMPLDIKAENWYLHAKVCEDPSSAINLFHDAWIKSALGLGPWSFRTLAILEEFSNHLLRHDLAFQWRDRSLRLVAEFCLASHCKPEYGFRTERIFQHLEKMWPGTPVVSYLSKTPYDDSRQNANELRLHVARSTISTVVELYAYIHGDLAEYPSLEAVILLLLKECDDNPRLQMSLRRELTMCRYMQSRPSDATSASSLTLLSNDEIKADLRLVHEFDRAILASSGNHANARQDSLSVKVFFLENNELDLWPDMFDDIRARLSRWGLSHFYLQGGDVPFAHEKAIGHGSFASVDLVGLNGRQFARKVTIATRRSKEAIRKSVLREVEVMRLLHHPHIVSVYCTYEVEQQFAIILEPAAECDLEEYLDHVNLSEIEQPLDFQHRILRWMLCLARTLAHIHQNNVRHKDIKSQNILVQNDCILFADFGSSRVFTIESSTTEGPSVGHTRMYSAPEVISEEKRNKSADVFSLGCVFSEMLTVIGGRTTSQYRYYRRIEALNHPQHGSSAYHTTLDRVEDWFTKMDAHTEAHKEPRDQIINTALTLYRVIVKPMLDHQAESRPTALQVAERLRSMYAVGDNCPDCAGKGPLSPLSGLEVLDLLGLMPQSLEHAD